MHEDLGIPRSYLTIAHEKIISFFISRILFSLVAIAVLKAVLYPFESCPIPKGLFEQGELTVEDCWSGTKLLSITRTWMWQRETSESSCYPTRGLMTQRRELVC